MLSIELIPKSTWYDNVRSRVSRDVWVSIRNAFAKAQCQICGFKYNLQSHEVWRYDDINHIQKLVGFMCLCGLCRSVKHLGLAGIMAQRGDLDYSRLIKHYCDVNECSEADFKADRKEAFELWKGRSGFEWRLDLLYLDDIVTGIVGTREYMRTHPTEVERIKQKRLGVL